MRKKQAIQPSTHTHRRLVLIIENDTIGENLWMPTVAKTLRDYADAVDRNWLGRTSPEVMTTPNGNKVTILGGSYIVDEIPDQNDFSNFNYPRVLVGKDFKESGT